GPQVGSRTLPLSAESVWRTRPSTEITARTLRPPCTELYRICIPFGAKLGDSSSGPAVNNCSDPDPIFWIAIRKAPSLRVTYTRLFASGDGAGEILYLPPKVMRWAAPPETGTL